MFKIIVFFILFDIYIASENNTAPLYEIELPNDDNNLNLVKVLQIFENNGTNNFNLNISYKFDNDLNNTFSINSKETIEILSCIISQNCDNPHKLYTYDEIRVKYYENGIFPICIYKRYTIPNNKKGGFRTICLDKSEYKRFINIVAYLLNVIQV